MRKRDINDARRRGLSLSRRDALKLGIGAAAVAGFPAIVQAQRVPEIVIGGAASHKPWMDKVVIPMFERKYNCKILYEGTRSTINLEKMRAAKDRPVMSVVQMDDPVMIQAVEEDLIEPISVAQVPNLAKIKPGAVHMDGMWANYQQPWAGVAYNTQHLPQGVPTWVSMWEPRFKGKVVLPSLQNTEGPWVLFMAAHLETGKPLKEAQYDIEAAFKRLRALKPNLLTIYTNLPQAFNLLEQGEAWLQVTFSSWALLRKQEGSPVDLAAPKEGIFAMPSGICLVKGAPHRDLALAYINEMLGAELQTLLTPITFSLPTHVDVPLSADIPQDIEVFTPDWAWFTKHRAQLVERWDREMAI